MPSTAAERCLGGERREERCALGAGGLILPAKIPAVSRRSLRVRGAGIGSQISRAAPRAGFRLQRSVCKASCSATGVFY